MPQIPFPVRCVLPRFHFWSKLCDGHDDPGSSVQCKANPNVEVAEGSALLDDGHWFVRIVLLRHDPSFVFPFCGNLQNRLDGRVDNRSVILIFSRRPPSGVIRSSTRGATEMAHMLMAGNFISQALAMTENTLLRLLSCASTSLMMVLSPPTYPILSRSLPPNFSLSLACRNKTHPIAIDAANNSSGIVGVILIFPAIVSSKMFLAVHSGSRLAAKAAYLAEMVSSSRCFRTYS